MFNGVLVGTYSQAWENSNKHHPPLQSVPGTGPQQIPPSLHAKLLSFTQRVAVGAHPPHFYKCGKKSHHSHT